MIEHRDVANPGILQGHDTGQLAVLEVMIIEGRGLPGDLGHRRQRHRGVYIYVGEFIGSGRQGFIADHRFAVKKSIVDGIAGFYDLHRFPGGYQLTVIFTVDGQSILLWVYSGTCIGPDRFLYLTNIPAKKRSKI